ncbi:MAG TPA: 16S rRNA (guanine(527)-N(7))-methyltransferase RsmG [Thermomicrobiales bacterium]|nr:16S rRNA (guanine(527)-N(7))-methyltransferase RsmG [Thermomicrobiales bacterium]
MRLLTEHAGRLGVQLDAEAVERFRHYRDLLLAANERFNLTRITDPNEVELRLFADSLSLLPHLPDDTTRLLDIGSGGGVPGMALAIAHPELPVTLLDATAKKVRFLAETAAALGLEHVTAIQGRAEELARDPHHRELYSAVTARAVARLATLVELALPFLALGGRAILPKGSAAAEELAEARYAIGLLGGRARPPVTTPLEGTTLVIIDKRKPTPATYPRNTGTPNKSPLRG